MNINCKLTAWLLATGVLLLAAAQTAHAEPYLAVQKGMQCSACHSHPAGGGKRSAYGNIFAQSELAERRIGDGDIWTGEITKWLSVGGDLRASYKDIDTPNRNGTSEFAVDRGAIYVEATIIPGRLSVYVDEKVAPDDIENREAYLRLNSKDTKWFVSAGQFYLPYGLRLQDDTAFVRVATGINFTNWDRGVQGGYDSGPWSIIASATNNSGGGRSGSGEQVSVVSSYANATWRAGASVNVNNEGAGDRTMFGFFGGLKTGPVAWLAEVDSISDDVSTGVTTDAFAGLLEANWTIRGTHNLKFSYDYLDPNDDISEDHQVRYSVVWEHSPIQFLQARAGFRRYDGIPQVDAQDRKEFFIEIHGFF